MAWWRRDAGQEPTPGPRVTLVDRTGCHLCDQAAVVLDRVTVRTGDQWARVDVDSSPELLRLYDELVPVVLVDGRQISHYTVSEEQVLRALRRRHRRGDASSRHP
jgi:hypothetical protein